MNPHYSRWQLLRFLPLYGLRLLVGWLYIPYCFFIHYIGRRLRARLINLLKFVDILVKSLAVFGAVTGLCLLTFIIIFGPRTYRFIRDEFRYCPPLWLINLRLKKHRLRTWLIYSDFSHIMLIVGIICAFFLALIITTP